MLESVTHKLFKNPNISDFKKNKITALKLCEGSL